MSDLMNDILGMENPKVDLDEVKKKMDHTFQHGKPRGELCYFEPIDQKNMFTWKRGFLYCITGNPGSGKSEFLNHLAVIKSLKDKWKWVVYSPESYPVEDYIDTLIYTLTSKFPHKKTMNKSEYDKAFKWVKEHFEILDFKEMPRLKQIQDYVSKVKAEGIIIDPYNSIDNETGDLLSEGLKNSLTRFKMFALQNKMAVVLIEHPKAATELDESGNPREPSQYNLYGGSMWNNKCDVIGVVHRPHITDRENTIVTFRTRKIKNQKLHGYPDVCHFNFDRRTNRYFWRKEEDGQALTYWDQPQEECPF